MWRKAEAEKQGLEVRVRLDRVLRVFADAAPGCPP